MLARTTTRAPAQTVTGDHAPDEAVDRADARYVGRDVHVASPICCPRLPATTPTTATGFDPLRDEGITEAVGPVLETRGENHRGSGCGSPTTTASPQYHPPTPPSTVASDLRSLPVASLHPVDGGDSTGGRSARRTDRPKGSTGDGARLTR